MPTSLLNQWRESFFAVARTNMRAQELRDAALRGHLSDWTKALTAVTVETCRSLGWYASAKDHHLDLLPVPHYEYLTMDVMAFTESERRWHFPIAVCELENSRNDDRIAYSLWKVLCVRADLRVVFCYRSNADEGAALIRKLRDEVIQAIPLAERVNLSGDTAIVVGSRDDATTFPYGFFKWWHLDANTGIFRAL